jgi:hypothetical protein
MTHGIRVSASVLKHFTSVKFQWTSLFKPKRWGIIRKNQQPDQNTFMAKILSVSSSEVLNTTRRLLLEHEGFTVCSALTLAQVEALGKTSEKVDLALICHGFRGVEKRKIAHTVNQYYPGLPILEMCFHSPEIPGADFILSDAPHELIAAIGLVLQGRRVRGYTE